ncbi:hemerythrin domain-containing protein [Candidatus Parcubacteria bacterium]|jgi:regulator of sigma D|nr:hemerythrin domain-containing protein [Candidatus Parcubacteria bacterium]MBT7228328.1 hemerythrin domain-containing protein [Candidatus Parcubacteria bacterium]
MDKKTIITILIGQHRALQKDLGTISGLVFSEEQIDFKNIIHLLQEFTKDLLGHLKLENETFYPELLDSMKAKNQDIVKTELFIAEMKTIEVAVTTFLEKYKEASDIEEKLAEFKKEFPNIIETLNLRIESEEVGVYSYWGLF